MCQHSHMTFLKRLFFNILIYCTLFIFSFFTAPAVQGLLTGSSNSNADLLSVFVVMPIVFLSAGWVLGKKTLKLHLLLFFIHLALGYFIFVNEQLNPNKDFNNSLAPSWFFCFILALVFRTIFVKSSFRE